MPNPTKSVATTRAQARVSLVVQPRLRLAEESVAFSRHIARFVARKKTDGLAFFVGALRCGGVRAHQQERVGACSGNNPLETHPDEA